MLLLLPCDLKQNIAGSSCSPWNHFLAPFSLSFPFFVVLFYYCRPLLTFAIVCLCKYPLSIISVILLRLKLAGVVGCMFSSVGHFCCSTLFLTLILVVLVHSFQLLNTLQRIDFPVVKRLIVFSSHFSP